MNDEREEQGGRFPWVITLMVMMVLYPLSVGPVVWVSTACGCEDSSWVGQGLSMLYAPLGWMIEQTGTINIYARYYRWWLSLVP